MLDHRSAADGKDLVGGGSVAASAGPTRNESPRSGRQDNASRTAQASVSAALAAANVGAQDPAGRESKGPAFPLRFPGEDGGHSLAEVAQRNLDAALQLLADRAQYITGAGGAAIALRRTGKNDLLCRASAGSNAPELGALLSTEFGLSGESVRTRRALRCDDAERDARVNRQVCRELGIASVVVMPVVDDDQVLGVFELFSGKAHAFGERDLSALERLSQMVETAVRMARAAESLPERLSAPENMAHEIVELPQEAHEQVQETVVEVEAESPLPATAQTGGSETAAPVRVVSTSSEPVTAPQTAPKTAPQTAPQTELRKPVPASKPLFWSVALSASGEGQAETERREEDQSHVPPSLRNLRKCEACGFPVSAGRALCVECEEKKWRGQLKKPRSTPQPPAAPSASVVQAVPEPVRAGTPANQSNSVPKPASAAVELPSLKSAETSEPAPAAAVQSAAPDFVLSAGLEPAQSWFSRNKYIIVAVIVVGAAVAGAMLLR
ncbi:MAG TPA: GAF domain-containing protein [Terriglobales bacterium]|nr:GAF domain-containing protein [Terriglobales bacterium]